MTKTIAVINQKGGVGKTTTVANLGYALANSGKKVLLIDYDAQASLTNYLNVGLTDQDEYYSIYEIMVKELRDIPEELDPFLAKATFGELFDEAVIKPTYTTTVTKYENGKKRPVEEEKEFGMYLLPSKLDLSDYELELSSNLGGNGFHLTNVIEKLKEWNDFDYIIIDCSPSLGILTTNALIAATDGILIPTNLDLMSTRGVKSLIARVVEVQEALKENGGMHYGVIGIILNLYSDRRTVDKNLKNQINEFYPFKMFDSCIPESINAKKAVLNGVTYSQMYKKAEMAYRRLAAEIEERLFEMEKEGPVIQTLDDSGDLQLTGEGMDVEGGEEADE